ADRPWPREVWVEAKARTISLSDRDLISEVQSYLSSWLLRQPEARFKLMVFIENARNPAKWETIWGKEITEETIVAWLSKVAKNEANGVLATMKLRAAEIVSF